MGFPLPSKFGGSWKFFEPDGQMVEVEWAPLVSFSSELVAFSQGSVRAGMVMLLVKVLREGYSNALYVHVTISSMAC